MKKHLFICILIVLTFNNLYAATFISIDGPSNICPTASTTYTARYELLYNPSSIIETVTEVKWEFIKNGTVVQTLYSTEFTRNGMVAGGSAKRTVSNLPAGDIKIRVTLALVIIIPGFGGGSTTYPKTKNIYVGIPEAPVINGTPICPNSSGVFSIESLPNATSYTWEVPAGWKVNGNTGPVVTTPGTTVTITPCPFTNDSSQTCKTTFYTNYTIKVKGVSATCGTGNYTTRIITIDYPATITETNLGNNNVRLNASPNNFPSYQWTLDPVWFFPTNGNKTLPEISFNSRGITGLAKLTYKTPCQNTYTREWWWVPPAQPGDPGWTGDPPQDPDPGDCEPEIPTNPNAARSGNVIYVRDPCGEEPPIASLYANGAMKRVTLTKSFDGYEYDISELTAGQYILRVKTAEGKFKTVKFIMLD
jgi:hypothetical protein